MGRQGKRKGKGNSRKDNQTIVAMPAVEEVDQAAPISEPETPSPEILQQETSQESAPADLVDEAFSEADASVPTPFSASSASPVSAPAPTGDAPKDEVETGAFPETPLPPPPKAEEDFTFDFSGFDDEAPLPSPPETPKTESKNHTGIAAKAHASARMVSASRPVSSRKRAKVAPVVLGDGHAPFGPRQALSGVLAILLMSLAIPSLVVGLMLVDGNDTREALNAGQQVEDADLMSFYRSRLRVHSFHATNEVLGDLAMAAAEGARRAGFETQTGKDLLQEAFGWQTRALQVLPADGFGWSRYLYLASLVEGVQSPKVPLALTFEIETAPYEPTLFTRRLGVEMALFDRLDPDLKRKVPALMRQAWSLDPDAVEAAAKAGHYYEQLLTALRASSETAELLKKWRGL